MELIRVLRPDTSRCIDATWKAVWLEGSSGCGTPRHSTGARPVQESSGGFGQRSLLARRKAWSPRFAILPKRPLVRTLHSILDRARAVECRGVPQPELPSSHTAFQVASMHRLVSGTQYSNQLHGPRLSPTRMSQSFWQRSPVTPFILNTPQRLIYP